MWWTFRKENGFHPRSKYGYNQFLLQNRCMMQCHFRVSSLFFCSNTQRSIPPRLGYVALRWCAVSTYLYVHSIGNRSGFTAWYGQTGFVLLPRDFFLRRLVMNSECDFPQSLPFAVMVNCACRWIFFSRIFLYVLRRTLLNSSRKVHSNCLPVRCQGKRWIIKKVFLMSIA